jgi:hypothetical protein
MQKALIVAAIAAQLVSIGPALSVERSDAQSACAATAFKDYLTENQALNGGRSISVQIEQRRLQERFCARFVQCVVHERSREAGPVLAARFSDCLKEEAVELYKLYKD